MTATGAPRERLDVASARGRSAAGGGTIRQELAP